MRCIYYCLHCKKVTKLQLKVNKVYSVIWRDRKERVQTGQLATFAMQQDGGLHQGVQKPPL